MIGSEERNLVGSSQRRFDRNEIGDMVGVATVVADVVGDGDVIVIGIIVNERKLSEKRKVHTKNP